MPLETADFLALAWFLALWLGYSLLVERSAHGHGSLTALMHEQRKRWMDTMTRRENRIVDTAIMASLQQGTAFFASTSLLAIGGSLALLRASDEAVMLARTLPFAREMTRGLWETKVLGLAVLFVYAFFKFSWAYRLFNYAAILIGAVVGAKEDHPEEASRQAMRAASMQTIAAGHFNRGQRAFFFALGYLGWFLSPLILALSATAVAVVIYRRQFTSAAVRAVREE